MKNFVHLFFLFAGCMLYAQVNPQSTSSLYRSGSSDFITGEEGENPNNLDFNTFMHLYISSHLNDAEVKGQGKSETLLTLEFADNGTLRSAAATGRNNSLNKAVLKIFKHRKGKRFSNIPALNAHRFNIPIILKH